VPVPARPSRPASTATGPALAWDDARPGFAAKDRGRLAEGTDHGLDAAQRAVVVDDGDAAAAGAVDDDQE